MKNILGRRSVCRSLIPPRWFLIMKLALLIVTISVVQAMGSVYSQHTELRIDLVDATIEELFKAIEEQSDFDFFYNNEEIDVKQTVSQRVISGTITFILDQVFPGSSDIAYTIIDTHIVLYKKGPSGLNRIMENPAIPVELKPSGIGGKELPRQQIVIRGRVLSERTGLGLIGVNIREKGTLNGTITGTDGAFSLEVTSDRGILVFSFIGFETVEKELEGRRELTVSLRESYEKLDEVVVIGYGYQKKSDLTGSVSSIKSEELLKVPVRNLDQALKGQASGVFVTEPSGAPGATASIRIRGTNSITASNEPLFIVDGFQVSNIEMINPTSIQSIEVLKDASATAIYGSRGANGVVLITTKRGESGKTRIQFDSYFGMQRLRKKIDMLNGSQYATMVNEAIANSNLYLDPADQYDLVYENPESFGEGTDWQEEIFRDAPIQSHQLSLMGGDQRTRYALTGNIFDQRGILTGSGFSRMSFRTNLDHDVSEKLHITSNLYFSRTKQDHAASSNVKSALIFAPVLPVKDTTGDYHFINDVPNGALVVNPVSECREKTDFTRSFYSLMNVAAGYEILNGLTLRVSLGGEIRNSKRSIYEPRTTYFGSRYDGRATVSSSLYTQWQNENTLTYARTINDNNRFNLLAGFTAQQWNSEFVTASAQGFVNDNLSFYDLDSGSQEENDVQIPRSGASDHSLVSILARANYVWKEKYLFTATMRRDGSSRFGAGNKWGLFPSGALAWRLSEEEFIDRLGIFSNLKARLSYGITGNQEIGNYQSLALMSSNETVFGNSINTGFSQIRLPNENLRWESTSQLNLGFDMSFFRSRLSITADIYKKWTRDLLLEVKLPLTSGFKTALKNVGSTENQGIEWLVHSVNTTGRFQWTTDLNVAFNQNRVVDIGDNDRLFPEGSAIQGNQQEVVIMPGQPLGSFFGYVIDGLFQNEEEIAAYPHDPGTRPGDYRFVDLNNDGIISEEDRRILGYGQPDFYGGITNNILFRGFEFSALFYGVYGADILARYRYDTESLAAGRQNNSTAVLDRWKPGEPDPATTIPRATAEGRVIKINNYFIEDGSFFQLRSLTLAYTFPGISGKAGWLEGLRIYLTAKNLWTLTSYSGYDPEVNVYGKDQVMFNIDYDPYPKSKSLILGFNLSL